MSNRAREALERADGNEATVSCTAPVPTSPPTPGPPPPTPEDEAWYRAKLERARAKRRKLRRKWAHDRKMRQLKWVREVEASRKLAKSDPEFAATQDIHGTDPDIDEIDKRIAAYLGADPLTLQARRVKLGRGNGDPKTTETA